MTVISTINQIAIEKFCLEIGCKKKYPNGTVRLIKAKKKTMYRAVSPSGHTLYEHPLFTRVKSYAANRKVVT